jgi:cysteine desulfurase
MDTHDLERGAERRAYFDWAAAAPQDPAVQTIPPWANPSARHREGRAARAALEDARSSCAAALGVQEGCLFFTSGGTESNILAMQTLLLDPSPSALLYSAVEHPSIRENAPALARFGKEPRRIGVGQDGRVSEAALERALRTHPAPCFAAIMGVNNETGACMDIPALARLARSAPYGLRPLHIHSDLVQAAGKIPLNLADWDIDSAAISGHKIGAPRGTGLLYLRRPRRGLFAGGGQERGVRPGTENALGALALAASLTARLSRIQEEYQQAAARFCRLIRFLKGVSGCTLIPQDRGEHDPRFSPYILQAAFRGIPGEVMVRLLDDAGFAVSTGSACSSRAKERPVLAAMKLDPKTAGEGIRVSQGWSTADAEIDGLIRAIPVIVSRYGGESLRAGKGESGAVSS